MIDICLKKKIKNGVIPDIIFIGIGFISVGVLINEWMYLKVFDLNGFISNNFKLGIRSFNLVFILVGIITIINHKKISDSNISTIKNSLFYALIIAFPILAIELLIRVSASLFISAGIIFMVQTIPTLPQKFRIIIISKQKTIPLCSIMIP